MPKRGDEHRTPRALYEALDLEFDFEVDAAATPENALRKRFFTDAMNERWHDCGSIFVNPPYSAPLIGQFMQRCHEVCIMPAGEAATYAIVALVRMLTHRVRFEGETSAYNFPSAVVVYLPGMGGTIYRPWWYE